LDGSSELLCHAITGRNQTLVWICIFKKLNPNDTHKVKKWLVFIERDNFKGLKGTIDLLKIKEFDVTIPGVLCLILKLFMGWVNYRRQCIWQKFKFYFLLNYRTTFYFKYKLSKI
jgi:hypothetical protein